jgi:hypothetical protein
VPRLPGRPVLQLHTVTSPNKKVRETNVSPTIFFQFRPDVQKGLPLPLIAISLRPAQRKPVGLVHAVLRVRPVRRVPLQARFQVDELRLQVEEVLGVEGGEAAEDGELRVVAH